MSKKKSLKWQAIAKLNKMAAYGQKKHLDKELNHNKPAPDKIYSYKTMENYQAVAIQFTNWAKETHGCRTLDEAQRYTGEYLAQRDAAGLSAWTIRRDAAALGKLYQTPTTSLGYDLPTRYRGNVTQHRTPPREFNEANHSDLAALCRSCGLRRHEIKALKPSDVKMEGNHCKVIVQSGKGGKRREVIALDNTPARLAAEAAAAGRDHIVEHIPTRAPIHSWRSEFAQKMYDSIARPVDTIPRKEQYRCRMDKIGTIYDKNAMQEVSTALGHNRLCIVTNYIK